MERPMIGWNGMFTLPMTDSVCTVLLGVDLLLFGIVGLTVWAVQLIWIPFWAAGVINGLGHYWGYRNYEPRDASTNLSPIGHC
jgi:stearoyl-CoA desaturase (delta-9 desaturase)